MHIRKHYALASALTSTMHLYRFIYIPAAQVSDGRPSVMFFSVYFTVPYGCRFLPFTIASVPFLYFYTPSKDVIIYTGCPVKGGTTDEGITHDEMNEKCKIDSLHSWEVWSVFFYSSASVRFRDTHLFSDRNKQFPTVR